MILEDLFSTWRGLWFKYIQKSGIFCFLLTTFRCRSGLIITHKWDEQPLSTRPLENIYKIYVEKQIFLTSSCCKPKEAAVLSNDVNRFNKWFSIIVWHIYVSNIYRVFDLELFDLLIQNIHDSINKFSFKSHRAKIGTFNKTKRWISKGVLIGNKI